MAVLAGVEAFQDRVPQLAVEVPDGFESLTEETNVPDDAKPVSRKALNPKSLVVGVVPVVLIVQVTPPSTEITRVPFA